MISMGLTQAREMVGEIRKAAAAFIACADEHKNDPVWVADYLDGLDDKITRYIRSCCGADAAMMDETYGPFTAYGRTLVVAGRSIEMLMKKTGLNLGCGDLDQGHHYLNVDKRLTPLVDVLYDLSVMPWPFTSEYFEAVAAVDIMEHFIDAMGFVEECWRVLKPGGRMRVRTTHWQTEQSYRMLDHYHFCTPETFAIFDPNHWMCQKYPYYSKARFNVLKAEQSGQELEFDLLRL